MSQKRRQRSPIPKSETRREQRENLRSTPSPAANNLTRADSAPGGKHGAGLWLAATWRRLKDFSALSGEATYLWPRWLVLRAVGFVYIFVFAGIIVENRAMIGPTGVAPLAAFLAEIKQQFPGTIQAFLTAPTLFWLNTSAGMITALAWVGLAAAVALLVNLWPRVAVAVCWLIFLSFVASWADFSSAQLDRLMLETALLCIPFAPRGRRPGLGAESPPRPIAVFAMRWLLFRVMFESGVVKLISPDPHWRNLTAMDAMYETAPSPTILGYWAHQLPHGYHVFEIALTFAAELLAPIAAVFAGRPGRWFALLAWTGLQAGIQLTCNFGWLNTAALGLGLVLLDDQMIARAAGKLGLGWGRRLVVAGATLQPSRAPEAWRLYGLRAVLGIHFGLTLFYFAEVFGMSRTAAPALLSAAVKPFAAFCSANGYFLYERFDSPHHQVDFEGSNDGGKTWRTYDYRHVPQRVDRVSPFLAPWFPRFEATIQIESWSPDHFSMLPLVARQLLARNPAVMNRFERDPFPDHPPTVVRMRRYRLAFTDLETHRRTGRYWRKEFDGDFAPAMYVTEKGGIAQFSLTEADVALKAGNYQTALAICEQQYRLGNLEAGYLLADIYFRGLGVAEQPEKSLALFSDLADRGEIKARHNLGLCYEHGVGVPVDILKAAEQYRNAAERGNLASLYALGALAADDLIVPRDDVEGLSLLLKAAARIDGAPSLPVRMREDLPAKVKRLTERMSAEDIAKARLRASGKP